MIELEALYINNFNEQTCSQQCLPDQIFLKYLVTGNGWSVFLGLAKPALSDNYVTQVPVLNMLLSTRYHVSIQGLFPVDLVIFLSFSYSLEN